MKFSYTADITSMNPPLTMTDSHLSPSLSELLPPALNPQGVGSETFITPPIDGTLVLPQIIDHHLTNTTEHPLFLFEESPGHLRKILWPEAARAVHRTAKLVISLLAPLLLSQADPTAEAPVISILASADTITYFSLIHGALRAGYRPFPISPRNSPAAVAHLLSKTNSKFVFVSHDAAMQDLYAASLKLHDDAASMHTFPMPKFEELYPQHDEAFEPLPLIQHPGLESLAMVLHSSGAYKVRSLQKKTM